MSTVMSRDALLEHAPPPGALPLYIASSERVFNAAGANAIAGEVRWKASKSIWITTMTLGALILGPLTFTPGAFAVFFITYLAGLCLGQTLGMHRLLIHRSFECPLWLERLLVYLGTIAGVQGPLSWIRNHDLRDWAQSQPECHPYLSQQGPIGRDYYWQTHCQLILEKPPQLIYEPRVANDPFYRFIERYFYLNQVPVALLLYALGGWPWVVWGMCARVAATVTGTWNMLYWAHNDGVQNWLVKGAGIQGYNVPYSSWLSMGEAWHNNHHAYPLSARFGMKEGEDDPGWLMLKVLFKLGLVRDLQTPDTLPAAKQLIEFGVSAAPAAVVNLAHSGAAAAQLHSCSKKCSPSCGAVCRPEQRQLYQ
jgi:sn-1 stearoyl-lipid 9-desaturase